jgi:TonB family protein
MPAPPPRAQRAAPLVKKIHSPVPPVRKAPPLPQPVVVEPPKPVEPPKIDPPKIVPPKVEPPKPVPPTQTVQAPVVPVANDAANKAGVLTQPPVATPSNGPGTGGGVGTGRGTGMEDGRGGGIGAGSGGGTGGGPFQPGAGIDPPTLLREVKPEYTDEARKRSIAGDVVLEIVVRRDGTVSNLRVLRGLGAGLDEKAIDAVRQWRFAPAKRQGAAVDVVVQVSVQFSLR